MSWWYVLFLVWNGKGKGLMVVGIDKFFNFWIDMELMVCCFFIGID